VFLVDCGLHYPSLYMNEGPIQKCESIDEKVARIRATLGIVYTEEEIRMFENWERKLPQNSIESPIYVGSVKDVLDFLPSAPNMNNKDVEIFFGKIDGFSDRELIAIFEDFSKKSPTFEITLEIFNKDSISIHIGNKEACYGITETEYGHYHPTDILKNILIKENLPEVFLEGLMPSRGDLVYWERKFMSGQHTMRIFSKIGYVEVIAPQDFAIFDTSRVDEFAKKYFDLFLGQNTLGINTHEDLI